jgi:alkylation response protein AidB-like acyl-CoA dehydrogenase
LGPAGTLVGPEAATGGTVQMMALTAPCHGIMGGTEQIQKNIIGERILGLPKEPQVDRDVPFRELPV